MSDASNQNSVLSQSECLQLLSSVSLGRIVTQADGQVEIFPVNFVVHRGGVLIRTAEGTKLVSAVMNERVLFEADQHDAAEGWSVIVKGSAKVLRTDDDVEQAAQSGLRSWTASSKQHFVWIRPLSITGRRFVFDPVRTTAADAVVGSGE